MNRGELARIYEQGQVPISESGWFVHGDVKAGYPALQDDLDTDVTIIGAGFAGSSLALHLAELGVGAVVLESRQPGWGASGRTAGHVLPHLKSLKILNNMPGKGKKFLELFLDDRNIVYDIVRKYNIDCDADQSGLLQVVQFPKRLGAEAKKRAEWWRVRGCNVDVLEGDDLASVSGTGRYQLGINWRDGGRVNPYLFTRGMIAEAARSGARIHGDSDAVEIHKNDGRWIVSTNDGNRVSSEMVVLCTNGYTKDVVPELKRSYYPVTAYGLTTKPLPQDVRQSILPSGATLEQKPVNLHSFLIDGKGRIVTALLPRVATPHEATPHFGDLLPWLHRTFPATRETEIELEAYWTGVTAFSGDEFAKCYEVERGLIALMCFSGWGNLMAPLLGKHLANVLARGNFDDLAIPLSTPPILKRQKKVDFSLRRIALPLARVGDRLGIF